MVGQGHWLYQHTPNESVATKPPLVGWVSAALFEVTRWWEGAWRIPSFAAGVVLLWLIARWATAAYGTTARAARGERVWPESACAAPRDFGADRHAAGVGHVSDRGADLEKNSARGAVERA